MRRSDRSAFSTLAQLHDLARTPSANNLVDMIGPALQRAAALVEVERLVVHAGHAGLVPADVPKDRLDDMRRHAEALMQRGRERAAEIVQPPLERLIETRVEIGLVPLQSCQPRSPKPNTRSRPSRRGCAAKIADAWSDSGTTCSRRFFVRAGGRVIVAMSRSISDQDSDAISSRRAPVSMSSLTMAPYWPSPATRQIAASS